MERLTVFTRRAARFTGLALAIIGMCSFSSSMLLFEFYKATVPHESNVEAGRTYQEDDRGVYFYLNRDEHNKFVVLLVSGWFMALGGGIIQRIYRMPASDKPKDN